ncbi:N-acetylmuramoyl-L-alanine amidase CwlA precursor [Mycobacterium tuberculosis]|nr:N-acetylmuramoyl-L-alanine amidase CwlA precursor [Mycobacterium tuberculosis]
MLQERGWGIDRLRRHYDWSGKICPRLMYDGGKWTGWTFFLGLVSEKLYEKEAEKQMTKEERDVLYALRDEVSALKKMLEAATLLMPAPDWFVREFGSDDLNGLIQDPKMTAEGWRTTAIALRAQKKPNYFS